MIGRSIRLLNISMWMAALLIGAVAVHLSCCPTDASAQELGELQSTLGVFDTPQSQAFSSITDVIVDTVGRITVLDATRRVVSLFGPDLQWHGSAGRSGHGPEEFGEGVAAAVGSRGELIVTDAENSRLSRYVLTDQGPTFLGSHRIRGRAIDVCTLGDRVFIFTLVGAHLVHEIGPDGRILRSFGEREQPKGRLAREMGMSDHLLNQAELACDESVDAVVLAHNFVPLVRAYSSDGTALWRTELTEYHQQGFQRVDQGCCTLGIPNRSSGTYHMTVSALSARDGTLLLSLRESRPKAASSYELRRLDSRTGTEAGRLSIPGKLMAVANGLGYFAVTRPFPRILVYSFQREP